jgi:septal ring factor EnvC (AmiA/AmiB activator)
VSGADLLRDVLELASREKALEGDALMAFATALRDRAEVVLGERIGPLEDRIRLLEEHSRTVEAESAWRRQAMEGLEERVRGLETETTWRREAMQTLAAETVSRRDAMEQLEADIARGREEIARGRAELASMASLHAAATAAHQQLAGHHRDVVRQVISEVGAVAGLSWIHRGQARRRLVALAELLRPEAP